MTSSAERVQVSDVISLETCGPIYISVVIVAYRLSAITGCDTHHCHFSEASLHMRSLSMPVFHRFVDLYALGEVSEMRAGA